LTRCGLEDCVAPVDAACVMRILFLSNMYPPYDIGGYEQWCQEVADALRGRGHTLEVLTSRHGVNPGDAPRSQDGVTRVLHLQADLNYYQPADFFLKRGFRERANLRHLRETLDRFRPDVTMAWGMWNLSRALPFWAERLMPGRVTYYISSYWPADVDLHTQYWRLPARRAISEQIKRPLRALASAQLRREGYPPNLEFAHAVCCSRYVRDTLVAAGKLPDSASVLHGGIDPAPFSSAHRHDERERRGPLRLVYFGRLIEDKGVHTALEALGLLAQQGDARQVELTVLGSGIVEAPRTDDRPGIEDQVRFVGKVQRADVPAWLSRFDVFLFTSIWPEPLARTLMEAMAAGLVVVGTDAGGSPEIFSYFDEKLLFRPGDAQGLAERLTRLLADDELRRRLAQRGRQVAQTHFSLDRMVQEVEAHLLRVGA
jgi:glycosyltransferase involved in cell wall biosynthesis